MIEKILDIGKIIIDSWDKICHWYIRKKYERPSVSLLIKKESILYSFYLKNMSNEGLSVTKIVNCNLQIEQSDEKWRSKQGNNIYLLIFSAPIDLAPWAEEQLKPKIYIANKGNGEECWLTSLWKPHNYSGVCDIFIELKDKYGRLLKTENKVSWSGHTERIKTEYIK